MQSNNWFLILIISMLIGMSHLQADANPLDDHGDTYKEATDLFLDSSQIGQIDSAEDVDYFRLEITEPGELTVYTTGVLDTIGSIEDDAGIFANGDQEGDGNNFSIVYNAKPETYYISVRGNQNATGNYTLHTSFVPDPEAPLASDAETSVDPPEIADDHGDLWKSATELFFDSPEMGVIDTAEDVDYFRLEIAEPGELTVYTTGVLDTIGSIEDDTGIAFVEGDQEGDGNNFSIVYNAKPETYYISVRGYENATGDYILHANFVPGAEPPPVLPQDIVADPENHTRATASSLPLNSSRSGSISPAGDIDYWRVQVTNGGLLTLYTTGSTDTYGRIEDSDGNRLYPDDDDSGAGTNFRLYVQANPGTLYLRVTGYGNRTGRYTVHARFTREFGHTRNTAEPLDLNSSLSGVISPAGVISPTVDVDYFRVQVTTSGQLTVYTTGTTDTVGRLESSTGATLATNDDGGTGTNFRIVRDVTPGTYYIRVTGYVPTRAGPYTIYANFDGTSSTSPPSSDDPGNTRATATSLPLNSPLTGRIDPAGDIDYFRVQVTTSGPLTVETTGTTDTVGRLESSSGSTLATNDDGGTGTNFRIVHDVTPGTYYIRVTGYGSRTGSYTLNARLTSTTSTGDPGGTRATAVSLRLNSTRTETISPAGDIDYFRLEATSAGELTVETTGTTDTVGRLESSSGSTLATNDDGGTGYNFKIEHDVTPGTYYIRVTGYGSRTGSYTLNVSFSGTTNRGISLRLPDDFISEIVLGDSGAYFVWNAQYPTVMEDSTPKSVIYGKCTITLDFLHTEDNTLDPSRFFRTLVLYVQNLSGNPNPNQLVDGLSRIGILPSGFRLPNQAPYFMFPLLTPAERFADLQKEILHRHVGTLISSVIGLIPALGDGVALGINVGLTEWTRLRGIDEIVRSVLDPKIILRPGSLSRYIGGIPTYIIARFFDRAGPPPDDKLRYLVYIPDWRNLDRTGGGVNITVKVEQKYREEGLLGVFIEPPPASYERRLNLANNTWTAPSTQPMSLADYPPFQSLTPEVQGYLLSRFEAFADFWGLEGLDVERWRIPEETSLLPNYPNPFNPETWIPYQLSEAADVMLTIYDVNGHVVRHLDVGHQRAGLYHSRSRAAHWDGKNAQGESVASGVYFYTLKAGDVTTTRKMLIRK